ncbi:MAG: EAL domain-containing protein [Sphingomonadales bacterium]|nr:EAL domain-containing protein [Sphingomonadales bacterium]
MPSVGNKLRHLASAEGTLAQQVRAALVNTLYTSPASLVVGAVAGSTVAATIAYMSGSIVLLVCSIAIHIVGLLRIASAYIYKWIGAEEAETMRVHWERLYEIGAWLYASLLGLQTFLVLTQTDLMALQLLAVTMATGYAAGVAPRNAGRPVIAFGQVALAVMPMAAGLWLTNEPVFWILGVIIVIFALGVFDITLQTYEVVYSALSGQQEKVEVAERFEKMARSDMLTGLDNRLAMQMRLGELLDRIEQGSGEKLAVIWMDLDHFKAINDTLGHLAGDKVLIVTAQRVKAVLNDRGWLARFGGDEFVIMAKVSGLGEAQSLGEQIMESIAQPISVNDQNIEIGASLGFAVAPDHGCQSEAMLKCADIALYHAKKDGGKRVRGFELFMHEDFLMHRQIEQGLQEALAKNEFELLFQPIVDLASGKTRSCEALLRWHHPELGDVSPAVFIPVAENAGLIGKITEWVLEKACIAAAQWPENVNVSVNISAYLLKNPNLPVKIIETLVNTGMVARRLELEITESVLLDESPQVNSLLRQLQKMGLRLCLDDFGTGFSSLTYLRSWEFDTIKIDKSFISNIANSPTDQKIIRAVVQLAKSLEVATVAEGVETAEQLERVQNAGCSRVQGYYYAKPMTADQARERLRLEQADSGAERGPQVINLH